MAISDDDFIAAFRALGSPQKVANHFKVGVRSVYSRRNHIQSRYPDIDLSSRQSAIDRKVKQKGFAKTDWSYAWSKDEDSSILIHNPNFTRTDFETALEEAVETVSKMAPKWPTIRYKKAKDPHLLVVNVTDLHFGARYGDSSPGAVLSDAVDHALYRALSYDIDEIIFVMGSDALHVDNIHYQTSKGTPQETDGSTWSEMFKTAQAAYTDAVARLAQVAPVRCLHVSGNHDKLISFCLSQVIEATFSKAKNITFDVSDEPRKYHQYGTNLLCFTHGDKVKEKDMPMVISHEAAGIWGSTKWRYCYMGHLHHQKSVKFMSHSKEHPGIVLQWLRSPKPTDAWHRDRGLLGSQGVTSFVHSRDGGQVASFSVNL